ncbi:MAG: DEAD/DEAH box helicase family protein, partial [Proteobacteria bacterium]|nr:DEAD/DEAH box helicase family protein [Pseudomonadota bacterium]
MTRVRLLVFNPALSVLDYRLPAGMTTEFGAVVLAPLGPRQVLGIVWEPDRLPGAEVAEARLRPILEVLPVPPLPAALRRLIEWTAEYYCAPMNAVARMALGSMAALRGGGTATEYRLTGHEPARLTPQRAAALDALHGEQASIRELAELASVSDGVLRGMVNAGMLEAVTVDLDRPYPRARPDYAQPDLSPDQAAAAQRFVAAVRDGNFAPFLLDGVTGSGKTECYFEAVAEAIRQKRQVLVLLPEIALTENFLRRFEARFGVPPVLWHSSLKQ